MDVLNEWISLAHAAAVGAEGNANRSGGHRLRAVSGGSVPSTRETHRPS
jgi:hypothetical protein